MSEPLNAQDKRIIAKLIENRDLDDSDRSRMMYEEGLAVRFRDFCSERQRSIEIALAISANTEVKEFMPKFLEAFTWLSKAELERAEIAKTEHLQKLEGGKMRLSMIYGPQGFVAMVIAGFASFFTWALNAYGGGVPPGTP
jgi:hypothetical protein